MAEPGTKPILRIDDLRVRFDTAEGALIAVDGVTFDVRPGEFLSVIGPSGCGKSTVFNVVGGLAVEPSRPCVGRG